MACDGVVAVVNLIWRGKGGHRDREQGLAVTDDTIWRIYSMTKPIVGIRRDDALRRRPLRSTDDVGQWIDALTEPQSLGRAARAEPETAPAKETGSRAPSPHPHQRSYLRFSVRPSG